MCKANNSNSMETYLTFSQNEQNVCKAAGIHLRQTRSEHELHRYPRFIILPNEVWHLAQQFSQFFTELLRLNELSSALRILNK